MKKITFHNIVWYFFVFSFLGMLLENIVCIVTTGKIESRKGFIIGPFCPIYGFGAIILIILLRNERKLHRIFFKGIIVGTMFEYTSSYVMQAIYGVKFWDYKNYMLNINGRTALFYAISWGILSVILIYILKPLSEKIDSKFKSLSLDYIMFTFMTINCVLTYYSISQYSYRAKMKYNGVNVKYEGLMGNEVMKQIYPNMIYTDKDSTNILISSLLSDKESL